MACSRSDSPALADPQSLVQNVFALQVTQVGKSNILAMMIEFEPESRFVHTIQIEDREADR